MTPVTEIEGSEYGPIQRRSLATRMLQGAAIIAVMSIFTMFGAPNDTPLSAAERVAGLLLASLGGAVGGAVYNLTDPWRARHGWYRTLANIASILSYCVAAVAFIALWVFLTYD